MKFRHWSKSWNNGLGSDCSLSTEEKNPKQTVSLQHKQGRAISPLRKDSACYQDSVVSRQSPALGSFGVCLSCSVSASAVECLLAQYHTLSESAHNCGERKPGYFREVQGILARKCICQSSYPFWSRLPQTWLAAHLLRLFSVTSPTISRVFITSVYLILEFPSQPLLSENLA